MTVRHAPSTTRTLSAAPSGMLLTFLGVTLSAVVVLSGVRADGGGPGSQPPSVGVPAASGDPSPTASPTPTPSPTRSPAVTQRPSPTPSPKPELTPVPIPEPTVNPAPVSPPPSADGGPPVCAYLDVLTPHHGYGDWPISFLDTIYHLPADYAPVDLVDSSAAGLNGGYLVRRIVVADLGAMAADARAAGTPIALVSGYRSHAQQQATFDSWVGVGGYKQALRTSARAGHSEHQLGTAIDVTSEGGGSPWDYEDWATEPAGAWMAANAWRYGFVMSYPRGSYDQSCYDYEPWHYRYVGRDLAAEIAASGRVPRQVLWELQ
ncbi:MAG: D-alanyl-D-alanine carboxypeptidase family protein [Chloroflexota bacterium]